MPRAGMSYKIMPNRHPLRKAIYYDENATQKAVHSSDTVIPAKGLVEKVKLPRKVHTVAVLPCI